MRDACLRHIPRRALRERGERRQFVGVAFKRSSTSSMHRCFFFVCVLCVVFPPFRAASAFAFAFFSFLLDAACDQRGESQSYQQVHSVGVELGFRGGSSRKLCGEEGKPKEVCGRRNK